ncbi:sulfotransferase [Micractinium conductrix]|uniref:Sulfotransferase n=1 Tax=Micractinium conductrix TaxID=554055 RepID=A0A2P6V957_9CHLO|nr:sulfotransferase [Micractinium conductrix]|eukprot:PSC70605.1 sulfotransferase [Micractinium conductrix]
MGRAGGERQLHRVGVKDAKHILHLQEILAVANNKVMHIVRDGRDVAASLAARSNEYTWESSMGSCGGSGLAGRLAGRLAGWVDDNKAVLPFLADRRVLSIKFEDFFNADRVLRVLRQLAAFVRAPAPDERLLLALHPSTTPLTGLDRCAAYPNEAAKRADLAASSVQQLATMAAFRAAAVASAEAAAAGEAVEQPPDPLAHDSRRAWQSSQAWSPQESTWRQRLSKGKKADVEAHKEMQRMLQHFGYPKA